MTHARQRRPLFAPAWQVKSLADALHIDRNVIYEALRVGDLVAYRIGTRNFITTDDVVAWIKSHRRVKP